MNIPTILVLALIAAGVCAALRSLRRRKASGCGCGGCSGCAGNCKACGLLPKPTE